MGEGTGDLQMYTFYSRLWFFLFYVAILCVHARCFLYTFLQLVFLFSMSFTLNTFLTLPISMNNFTYIAWRYSQFQCKGYLTGLIDHTLQMFIIIVFHIWRVLGWYLVGFQSLKYSHRHFLSFQFNKSRMVLSETSTTSFVVFYSLLIL